MPATEQQKKELKKALAGSKALFEEALATAKASVDKAKQENSWFEETKTTSKGKPYTFVTLGTNQDTLQFFSDGKCEVFLLGNPKKMFSYQPANFMTSKLKFSIWNINGFYQERTIQVEDLKRATALFTQVPQLIQDKIRENQQKIRENQTKILRLPALFGELKQLMPANKKSQVIYIDGDNTNGWDLSFEGENFIVQNKHIDLKFTFDGLDVLKQSVTEPTQNYELSVRDFDLLAALIETRTKKIQEPIKKVPETLKEFLQSSGYAKHLAEEEAKKQHQHLPLVATDNPVDLAMRKLLGKYGDTVKRQDERKNTEVTKLSNWIAEKAMDKIGELDAILGDLTKHKDAETAAILGSVQAIKRDDQSAQNISGGEKISEDGFIALMTSGNPFISAKIALQDTKILLENSTFTASDRVLLERIATAIGGIITTTVAPFSPVNEGSPTEDEFKDFVEKLIEACDKKLAENVDQAAVDKLNKQKRILGDKAQDAAVKNQRLAIAFGALEKADKIKINDFAAVLRAFDVTDAELQSKTPATTVGRAKRVVGVGAGYKGGHKAPNSGPLFSSDKRVLKFNDVKIEPFNNDPQHKMRRSVPLRKALREVIGNKSEDSAEKQAKPGYQFRDTDPSKIKTLANSKLSELQGSGGNAGQDLYYPSSFDKEGRSVGHKVFLTAAEYKAYKTQAKVYFDPAIGVDETAQKDCVTRVLQVKSGLIENQVGKKGVVGTFTKEEYQNANLVTMILPTRIGVLSAKNGDATVQKPPIEAMVSTFTYPDFNKNAQHFFNSTPESIQEVIRLKKEKNRDADQALVIESLTPAAKTNIRAMLRLNILAVCEAYQTQGIKLPYILNMPGAFISKFNDPSKKIIKQEIVALFQEVIQQSDLKAIVQANISDFICIGSDKDHWGTPDATMPPIHIVGADIASIVQTLNEADIINSQGEKAKIVIPIMGDVLGPLGNGALGDRGDTAVDEWMARVSFGTHCIVGNYGFNQENLDQSKDINTVLQAAKDKAEAASAGAKDDAKTPPETPAQKQAAELSKIAREIEKLANDQSNAGKDVIAFIGAVAPQVDGAKDAADQNNKKLQGALISKATTEVVDDKPTQKHYLAFVNKGVEKDFTDKGFGLTEQTNLKDLPKDTKIFIADNHKNLYEPQSPGEPATSIIPKKGNYAVDASLDSNGKMTVKIDVNTPNEDELLSLDLFVKSCGNGLGNVRVAILFQQGWIPEYYFLDGQDQEIDGTKLSGAAKAEFEACKTAFQEFELTINQNHHLAQENGQEMQTYNAKNIDLRGEEPSPSPDPLILGATKFAGQNAQGRG